MKKNKAQISVEYLVVVSFVTFIAISILGIAFFYSAQIRDTIRLNQIDRFSNKITSAAESVFYSGEPSKDTVQGYFPEGINSVEIIENSIVISISTSGGNSKMAFPCSVPIEGAISSSSGFKKVTLTANSGKVDIS